MTVLTPVQVGLLESSQMRHALGQPTADDIAGAVRHAVRGDDGMVYVDLSPWRDALTAGLREIGPDSTDSTVTEAAENLVKQLS